MSESSSTLRDQPIGRLQRLGGRVRRNPRSFAIAVLGVVLVALIWAPPLVQEVARPDGNLTAIAKFYLHPPAKFSASHSLNSLIAEISAMSTVVPAGRARTVAWDTSRVLLVTAFFALGIVLCLAWWRKSRFLAWLSLFTPVSLLVAVASSTRVVGPLYPYLVLWTLPLLLPALIGGIALTVVTIYDLPWRRPRSPWRALASVAAALGLCWAATVACRAVERGPLTTSADSPFARTMGPVIAHELSSKNEVFQIDVPVHVVDDDAVILELAKEGLRFHVDTPVDLYTGTTAAPGGPLFIFTTPAVPPAARVHAHLVVREGDVAIWESD